MVDFEHKNYIIRSYRLENPDYKTDIYKAELVRCLDEVNCNYKKALQHLHSIYWESACYYPHVKKARVDAYKMIYGAKKVDEMFKEVEKNSVKQDRQVISQNSYVVNRGTFKKFCKENGLDPALIEKGSEISNHIMDILILRPIDPATKKYYTFQDYMGKVYGKRALEMILSCVKRVKPRTMEPQPPASKVGFVVTQFNSEKDLKSKHKAAKAMRKKLAEQNQARKMAPFIPKT